MKAILKVQGDYSLMAQGESLKKLMRLVMPCVEVEAQISTERPRSLPQHRMYFKRLHEFAENIPEKTAGVFWQNILNDLSIVEQIDADIVHELIKKILDVKSTAFHRMDQDAANEYCTRALGLIDRWEAGMQGVKL